MIIYNGRRICADGGAFDKNNPCEHWWWDGVTALIDQKGKIVADSLDMNKLQNLNWHSLQISDQPADTTLRVSLKSKKGRYYSFINYEKEFGQWFNDHYLTNTAHTSKENLFDIVCVEGLFKNRIRQFYSHDAFGSTYGAVLLKKLNRIKKLDRSNIQIIPDALNYMIYTQKRFKTFYTACGEANIADYPLFDVVISYSKPSGQFNYQEHFSFLRTASGYKLIGIAWKNKR